MGRIGRDSTRSKVPLALRGAWEVTSTRIHLVTSLARVVSRGRLTRPIGPAFELRDGSWAGEAQIESWPTYLGPPPAVGANRRVVARFPKSRALMGERKEGIFTSPFTFPRAIVEIMGLRRRAEWVEAGPTTGGGEAAASL